MTLKIKDREAELKYHFKTELVYEMITNSSFTAQTTAQWVYYFYATIVVCMDNPFETYKEYMDWLDDNPQELIRFMEWWASYQKGVAELLQESKKEEGKSKKKSKGKK